MSPDDFQSLIDCLPSDTPLTLQHVKVLFEIINNSKEKASELKDQNYSKWDEDKVINQEVLAEWLGVTTSALEKWRRQPNEGPKATIKGNIVRYRVGVVRDWIRENTFNSTTEYKVSKQEAIQKTLLGKKPKKVCCFGEVVFDRCQPTIFVNDEPQDFFDTLKPEMNVTGYEVRWSQSNSNANIFLDNLIDNNFKDKILNINEISTFLVDGQLQKKTLAHIVASLPIDRLSRYHEIVQILIEMGLDFEITDENGRTAETVAIDIGNIYLPKILYANALYLKLQKELPIKIKK